MIGRLHVAKFSKGQIKFGIRISGTVKETISLDDANGNTLCKDTNKIKMNK